MAEQNRDIKKFVTRAILFALPFLLVIFAEVIFLPIDAFTFRVWEAAEVGALGKALLPGTYYPTLHIIKNEVGDLGPHTKYAVKRNVVWNTDQFGYRTENSTTTPEVVIVGDSTIVGTGLSQPDILSEVLQKKTGLATYPLAASGIDQFLASPRFINHPPKVVVLASIERSIVNTPMAPYSGLSGKLKTFVRDFAQTKFVAALRPVTIFVDRLLKQNMYHYFKARIESVMVPSSLLVYNTPKPMLFLQGDAANLPVPNTDTNRVAQSLKQLKILLAARGIRFIFLPVPDKEDIYWQYMPAKKQPIFLPQLIKELKANGVEVVDTQAIFSEELAKNQTQLYQTDDTHWNAAGVELTAEALARMLKP